MNREDAYQALFESLRDLPRTDRGRKHAMRAICPPSAIEQAARFVDAVGLDLLIEEWLCADNPNRERRVGRPELVPPRAYLVAAMACSLAALPVSLTQVHHVLTADLTPRSRALFGLTVDPDPGTDARLDAARRQIGYTSVTRTCEKVTATFDPRPYPKNRGLTEAETDAIDAARDPAVVALRQRRADRLQAALLVATFKMLPAKVRKRWKGDITLDGTVIAVAGKFGHHSTRRRVRDARSPEAVAGWHAKTQDRRDLVEGPPQGPERVWTFGYDAHLAMMFTEGAAQEVPPLIVGLSLDTPGHRPGLNAATALGALRDQGLPAGIVTVDLGYSHLAPENYALPVRARGYALMHMFKKDQLGEIQATWQGLIAVEGTVYGPCLPDHLRLATRDFKEGRIDEATFEKRIEARRAYQARTKTGKNGKDVYVFRCPGCGPGRTVRCDLKPVGSQQEAKEAAGHKMLPLIVTAPADPPPCCTNAESVTVGVEKFARYVTALPYETPEWRAYYRSARNQMEGKNGFIKNPLGARIAVPGERRFRGWAKQMFVLLTKMIAANIETMLAWIDADEDGRFLPPGKRRGRPPSPGMSKYAPGPNEPPLRIIGRPPKETTAA